MPLPGLFFCTASFLQQSQPVEWGTSPAHKPWLVPPLGLKADRGSGTFPDELDAHVALLTLQQQAALQ